MFIRFCKGLQDKGILIPEAEIASHIDDPSYDYYKSPYYYTDDAIDYYTKNGNSIKGYIGTVWTDTLYFDLDHATDVEKSRQAAIKLLGKLNDLGLYYASELYFSGNKGFHVVIKTTNRFTPDEVGRICHNLAVDSGLVNSGEDSVFDTTVYNINRIFRLNNTLNKKSNLFKIPLDFDELTALSVEAIKDLARNQRTAEFDTVVADAEFLKTKYPKAAIMEVVPSCTSVNTIDDLDLSKLPPSRRRCIYILENGHFGHGERENACIRLAAYYRGQGFSKEHVVSLLTIALEKRSHIYTNLNEYAESDTERIVNTVFSQGWNGGTYSCASDVYLASKCSKNGVPCALENQGQRMVEAAKSHLISAGELFKSYVKYGEEALQQYPETGLEWLDSVIRLRPKNYSVLNGSNGSGKTSLALCFIEKLNAQKIRHIFFSLDMSDVSIFEKLATKYTNYSPADIERAFNQHTHDDFIIKRIEKTLSEKLPYTLFDFTSAASVHHIEKTILAYNKDLPKGDQIQMAFVDYAGRLMGDQQTAYASATANALYANDVVKKTGTHIMFISQISRENGDHTEALYSSRVAKESGAWEENATIIINCWRPMGNGLLAHDEYMHLYVAKNRSGRLEEHVFHWDGARGSVRDLTKTELQECFELYNEHQIMFPKVQAPESVVTEEDEEEHVNVKSKFRNHVRRPK